MPSTQEYVDYIIDLLSEVPELATRKMMGETMLYASGRLFGGIYDDRLLLKITPSAEAAFPKAERVLPYEGSKTEMILVDTEDRSRLAEIISSMLPELPAPKKRK